MHARVVDATVAMPDGPRVLWAQPTPGLLVVRATEPVTWQRLPAGYAKHITHRPWTPPQTGPHRAVLVWNPYKSRNRRYKDGRRVDLGTVTKDRATQISMLHTIFAGTITGLSVHIDRQWAARGWHHSGRWIIHTLCSVRLEGDVTDPAKLGSLAEAGIGHARAHGGALSIWEKLS